MNVYGGMLPGSKGYIYEMGLHVPMAVQIPENYRHLTCNKIGLQYLQTKNTE